MQESHTTVCGTMLSSLAAHLTDRCFWCWNKHSPVPAALQYWVHVAVCSSYYVLTSKSKSSHTKYFSHTEGTLPLSCQSLHPPTDIRESVAELGSLPKTSFLNGKNECLLSQVTRYCNKLYSENYRCCKWSAVLTPKTCILCLLKWGLN